jgi:hypothetical protein
LRSFLSRQSIDCFGQFHVTIRDSAGVVTGQPEIDPIPDAREFRMMIHLFRMQRDTLQETERLADVLEPKGADDRLAAIF